MRRAFVIMILSLWWCLPSAHAQIDSLKNVLSASAEDTTKVILLNTIAKQLLGKNPFESMKYSQEAAALSKKLAYTSGQIDAFKLKGTAFFYLGKYDSVETYWKKSLYTVPDNLKAKKADALNNMGVLYQRIGQVDSALVYNQQALDIRKALNDSVAVAKSTSNLATIYRQRGEMEKSLEYHLKALRVYEQHELTREVSDAQNSIGLIYMNLVNYDKALDYFYQSLEKREQLKNPRLIASVKNNIAGTYEYMKNFEEAARFYQEYLELVRSLQDQRGIAGALSNLGNIYKQRGDREKSLETYEEAARLFSALRDREGLSIVNINLGIQHIDEGHYQKAMIRLDSALQQANAVDNIDLQQRAAKGLSEAYERQKKFEKALKYRKLYSELRDSTFSTRTAEKVAELQELYEAEKKAREIQELQNEVLRKEKEEEVQRLYRNWAIAFSGLALLLLILLLNRYQLRKRLHKQRERILENEKEEYRLITELKQAEIEAKNRELSSMATHAVNKNKLLETLQAKLAEMKTQAPEEKTTFRELEKMISTGFNLDEDWQTFQQHFDSVHPQFFEKLNTHFPHLSANDLRNCAYIRMNLSTKEIASLMNITPKSAKMNRYRLKKKLELSEDEDIKNFIFSL